VPYPALKLLRDGLLSLAYPAQCRLCAQAIESWDDGVACAECWTDPATTVIFRDNQVCSRCGFPLPHHSSLHQQSHSRPSTLPTPPKERLCGNCETLSLHALRSVGLYRGALEASVLFLKSSPHICPRLFRLMEGASAASSAELSSDLIIPIPLHPGRKRERGFNQASVIARGLSRILSIPVDEKQLYRTKPTERHRAGMDSFDRAKSIANAFSGMGPARLNGCRVLLVDDLCTTGSTLAEAATALIKSGACQVSAFTIARAAIPS
jgi:ComF family protein